MKHRLGIATFERANHYCIITPAVNTVKKLKEALESALDFYFDDRRAVPAPSKPKRGQHVIELTASLSAKVLLLNEMIAQNVRPAELACRLKTTPQAVNRLTNVWHTTRIDSIATALKALGKQLELRAV